MSGRDVIIKLMEKNNGLIEAKEAKKLGIDNKVLQRMTQDGEIERIEQGLYLYVNYMEDEFFTTQYRCRKGIYSHETALFFHELCDRTPFRFMLTIPTGYNTRLIKDDKYQFFYRKEELWVIGRQKLRSPYGNEIIVYDRERTICDCILRKEKMDKDLVLTALKRYMKLEKRDLVKLLEYAEIFKIREIMRRYVEVLT